MLDLEFEAVASLLSELRNENKATAEYLLILDGRFSFLNTSDEDHKSYLVKTAVSDNSEASLWCIDWTVTDLWVLGISALWKTGSGSRQCRF